jgi:transglutaminase/protease-like cytokinesis protein 3
MKNIDHIYKALNENNKRYYLLYEAFFKQNLKWAKFNENS